MQVAPAVELKVTGEKNPLKPKQDEQRDSVIAPFTPALR